MSGYTPIEPGARKTRSGLAGCLTGCLVGAGVVGAIVVAVVAFVGWKLTRPSPPAPTVALRDGTETLFVHARLEPDDPGLNALAGSLAAAARDLARSDSGVPPMIDVPFARARFNSLPLDIDVVRRAGENGSDTLVGSFGIEGRPRTVRAAFRIASFFAPTDGTATLRRIERGERTILVLDRTVANPGAPSLAMTMVGERLVVARDPSSLEAALGAKAATEGDEPASLAGEVRLDGESGWGYTRPHRAASPDAVRLAVFSFQLAGADLLRWRAALRSEQAPRDKEGSVQALLATIAGASLPAPMKITLDRTTRWLDERTLVVDGTVDGIQGAVRDAFKRSTAGVKDGAEPERGTEPASPSR